MFISVLCKYPTNYSTASLLEVPAPVTTPAGPTNDRAEEQPAFIPLQKINVIARLVPTLETSRKRINEEMESMIVEGLASLVSANSRLVLVELPNVDGDRTNRS